MAVGELPFLVPAKHLPLDPRHFERLTHVGLRLIATDLIGAGQKLERLHQAVACFLAVQRVIFLKHTLFLPLDCLSQRIDVLGYFLVEPELIAPEIQTIDIAELIFQLVHNRIVFISTGNHLAHHTQFLAGEMHLLRNGGDKGGVVADAVNALVVEDLKSQILEKLDIPIDRPGGYPDRGSYLFNAEMLIVDKQLNQLELTVKFIEFHLFLQEVIFLQE